MGGNSGMTCKTCRHEAREAIDEALVAGTPHRSVAAQHGLSESSVFRHQQDHLSATLVKAAEAGELAHGERLLDRVNGLVAEALASIKRSKDGGKERDVLGGIREARNGLELVGRITGELKENNRESAPMTLNNYVLVLGKIFDEDALRRMVAGETTFEDELTSRIANGEAGATDLMRTIEGAGHLVPAE